MAFRWEGPESLSPVPPWYADVTSVGFQIYVLFLQCEIGHPEKVLPEGQNLENLTLDQRCFDQMRENLISTKNFEIKRKYKLYKENRVIIYSSFIWGH